MLHLDHPVSAPLGCHHGKGLLTSWHAIHQADVKHALHANGCRCSPYAEPVCNVTLLGVVSE